MEPRVETCNVFGSIGTFSIQDAPADHEGLIVSLWKNLPDSLRVRSYNHKGVRVVVRFDPSPIYALLNKQAAVSARARISEASVPISAWKVFYKDIVVPVQVEIFGRSRLSQLDWYAAFFAETFLYDLFLILNIALPVSADFQNLSVRRGSTGSRERLELSSFYFEAAYLANDSWPRLEVLDADQVGQWYLRARSDFSQVPRDSCERALFALLHLCRSQGRPEDIVWLFYALESLLQTRPGENYSALVDRIALLLLPDDKQLKTLRRNLRKLYDYRSSFVHGGLQVIHPMHWETMDERVEDAYSTTLDLSVFGARILLACLQRYAKENWLNVNYRTTIEVPSPPHAGSVLLG